MSAATRGVGVESYWTLLATTVASLFAGGGTVAGIVKWRADRDIARITSDGQTERTQIESDTSQSISMMTTLSARVGALEKAYAEQSALVHQLVNENAQLGAQNTILREQNGYLKRAVARLETERDGLNVEAKALRDAIQGPISEAMELLEDSDANG